MVGIPVASRPGTGPHVAAQLIGPNRVVVEQAASARLPAGGSRNTLGSGQPQRGFVFRIET